MALMVAYVTAYKRNLARLDEKEKNLKTDSIDSHFPKLNIILKNGNIKQMILQDQY